MSFRDIQSCREAGDEINMSLFVLVPFIASVSIVAVAHLLTMGNMKHADELSQNGVYVIAKGVKIFSLCGTVGLILMPFLIGGNSPSYDWMVYSLIDAMMVAGCLYVYSFRLELKSSSFSYRSFWVQEINYASVSDLRWFYSYRGNRYLVIIHDNKKTIKISDTVQKLDDFSKELGRRVDEATGRLISSGLRESK